MNNKSRILIVDDSRSFRKGMRAYLSSQIWNLTCPVDISLFTIDQNINSPIPPQTWVHGKFAPKLTCTRL